MAISKNEGQSISIGPYKSLFFIEETERIKWDRNTGKDFIAKQVVQASPVFLISQFQVISNYHLRELARKEAEKTNPLSPIAVALMGLCHMTKEGLVFDKAITPGLTNEILQDALSFGVKILMIKED